MNYFVALRAVRGLYIVLVLFEWSVVVKVVTGSNVVVVVKVVTVLVVVVVKVLTSSSNGQCTSTDKYLLFRAVEEQMT